MTSLRAQCLELDSIDMPPIPLSFLYYWDPYRYSYRIGVSLLKACDTITTSVPHSLNNDLSQKGYRLWYWKYMKGMLYRPWHIISSLQRATYCPSISIRMQPDSSDETVTLVGLFFLFHSLRPLYSPPLSVSPN